MIQGFLSEIMGHWPMQSKSNGSFLESDGPRYLDGIFLITADSKKSNFIRLVKSAFHRQVFILAVDIELITKL